MIFDRRTHQGHPWLIDASELDIREYKTFAWVLSRQYTFNKVIGVSEEGKRLAKATTPYCSDGPTILVDPVYYPSSKMREAVIEHKEIESCFGLVLFALAPLPAEIRAVFTLAPNLMQRTKP